jgi:hypothetical protein
MPYNNLSEEGMANFSIFNISNVKFYICGFFISLPLFLSVSGSGISLPNSHYEMSGIPLHLNIISLLIILPHIKYSNSFFLVFFLFLSYLTLSVFQTFDRVLISVQSVYFFIFYFCLNSLNRTQIISISRGAICSLLVFCIMHLLSIIINSGGSPIGMLSQGSEIWGFKIYQSYLTYPAVMTLGLFLYVNDIDYNNKLFWIFVFVVMCIELVLIRRVGLGIFFIFLILYRPHITFLLVIMIVFLALLNFIYEFGFDFSEALNAASRIIERIFDGDFTRKMTWERSIGYLNEIDILLIGNGLNNHSHNWFMHTLTAHGIFYSIVLFSSAAYVLKDFFVHTRFKIKPLIFIIIFIMIDWNLNANLYQPYYAGMLALVFISIKKPSINKMNINRI